MFNMIRIIFTVVMLGSLPFASHAEEFVKNGNPCLSGICVGDDLTTLRSIKWEPPGQIFSQNWSWQKAQVIDKLAPQATAVSMDVGAAILTRSVDSKRLEALSKIKGFCEPVELQGRFKSESGHLTTVNAQVFPSADGSSQTIRVTDIYRQYPAQYTSEQLAQLHAQFQQNYANVRENVVIDNINIRAPAQGEPTWKLDGTLLALDWNAGLPHVDRNLQNLLKKYPGCVKALKID